MTHRIQFNFDVANALVNGAAIPVPFVQQFVKDAYHTYVALQQLQGRQQEMEIIKSLLSEKDRKIEELQDMLARCCKNEDDVSA